MLQRVPTEWLKAIDHVTYFHLDGAFNSLGLMKFWHRITKYLNKREDNNNAIENTGKYLGLTHTIVMETGQTARTS